MKKNITLIGAVALASTLAFAGCSPVTTPAPTVTVTAQPEATKPVPTVTAQPAPSQAAPAPTQGTLESSEEEFIAAVYDEPYFREVPVAALLEAGHTICSAFDRGMGVGQVLDAAVQSGIREYEAGYLVAASVVKLCPDYIPLVQEFIDNNSQY